MAGVSMTVTSDDADVLAMFDRLASITPAEKRIVLQDLGEHLFNSTQDRARQEVSPEGIPWVPLSKRYEKRKEKVRPGVGLLRFDNHMLGDMFDYQVNGDDMVLGTNAIWGAIQQLGGNGVPEREWLGLSAKDDADIIEILGGYIGGLLDG